MKTISGPYTANCLSRDFEGLENVLQKSRLVNLRRPDIVSK